MKVNPNRDLPAAAPAARAPKRPAKPAAASESDFQASAKLALKLAATAEVRADQIARAKAPIADPNYPDPKTVQKIANRLANKIQPPEDSSSES